MIEVEKYNIDGELKQVRMVGEYVGVWLGFQKQMETKTITHNGIQYSAQVPNYVLKTGPWIGLLNVREGRNGECWLGDDPPIEVTYITSDEAEQIANELRSVIEYINSL